MRTVLARGLAAVSFAIVVYVAYAHLASWHVASQYSEQPIALRFDGADWARGFAVRSEGGAKLAAEGGSLHVHGTTSDAAGALADVEIAGPVRRLRELELRMRLRLRDVSSYDVSVGLERADVQAGLETTVGFGVRNGSAEASYRLFGDERADLPRAGDKLEKQRFVPFEKRDQEHEIALRFSPDLHAVLASVDGAPVSSHLAGWDDGVAVRMVLRLRARDRGQPIDAEIAQVDYVPLPRDTRPSGIDERFAGKVLDPRVWRVLGADGWLTEGDLSFLDGGGIRLKGRGLRPLQETPVVGLVGPTVVLGSFHASMRFALTELHHARLYFGFSNILFGLPDWRTFEVGLVDGVTQIDPFAAGHWEGDGQFQVTTLPGAISGTREGEIAIDYDAASGVATATLNGRPLARQRVDFQPPEEVRLQLGLRMLARDGTGDVRILGVRVEPRSWAAGDEGARRWAPAPPVDAGTSSFFDDFGPDSLGRYHVLAGEARWGGDAHNVQLGPDAPRGVEYHEIVRGLFDAPVTVRGSVFAADDAVRGANDSAGVIAAEHEGRTKYLAVLWYGSQLPHEIHITKQTEHGDLSLASAPLEIAIGKSYWVEMRVDRRNVYAKAWRNDVGVDEPSGWMVSAPIDDGWTATGGVGFVANATKTWATSLRAE